MRPATPGATPERANRGQHPGEDHPAPQRPQRPMENSEHGAVAVGPHLRIKRDTPHAQSAQGPVVVPPPQPDPRQHHALENVSGSSPPCPWWPSPAERPQRGHGAHNAVQPEMPHADPLVVPPRERGTAGHGHSACTTGRIGRRRTRTFEPGQPAAPPAQISGGDGRCLQGPLPRCGVDPGGRGMVREGCGCPDPACPGRRLRGRTRTGNLGSQGTGQSRSALPHTVLYPLSYPHDRCGMGLFGPAPDNRSERKTPRREGGGWFARAP
jgi:hypothetical protein